MEHERSHCQESNSTILITQSRWIETVPNCSLQFAFSVLIDVTVSNSNFCYCPLLWKWLIEGLAGKSIVSCLSLYF